MLEYTAPRGGARETRHDRHEPALAARTIHRHLQTASDENPREITEACILLVNHHRHHRHHRQSGMRLSRRILSRAIAAYVLSVDLSCETFAVDLSRRFRALSDRSIGWRTQLSSIAGLLRRDRDQDDDCETGSEEPLADNRDPRRAIARRIELAADRYYATSINPLAGTPGGANLSGIQKPRNSDGIMRILGPRTRPDRRHRLDSRISKRTRQSSP